LSCWIFETYFSKDYTLGKLTVEAYVRDKRFEPHGCATFIPAENADAWIPPLNLRTFFSQVDWSRVAILCHHAQFDGLILSHYYRVKPALWLDTLSMARLVHGNHISNSLASLARHYHLPAKSVPYEAFKGRHWDELSGAVQVLLADGGIHDCMLTYQLFCNMLPHVPAEELRLIDLTTRMFVEPTLRGDVDAFKRIELAEIARKHRLLAELQVEPKELASPERFAELLRAHGIEPPKKETAAGVAYAFAKTDKFMQEVVLEHSDEYIRTLGEARLGIRSTIEQTRAARLADMCARGPLPVYLQYCGAHTTRWSGGDKVNWQNFKRGSVIRSSIKAPAGYKIVKADKSQIECRFLNYLARQHDVVERFRRHEDPYVTIASAAYGETVYKAEKGDPRYAEMVSKRGTGKQLELSCGYGAGAATIQATAAKGTYGPPVAIDIDTAKRWRDIYRHTHPKVVAYWYAAETALDNLAHGSDYQWSIFKCTNGRLMLPNGVALQYPELGWDAEANGWRYKSRYGWRRIWGGFLVENVIQAVSRVDIGQCMLRLTDMGYRIVLMEHDCLGVLVRSESAEHDLAVILEEMRHPPDWCPDIPLDAEGEVGETYA
jgi:DNA polymerase